MPSKKRRGLSASFTIILLSIATFVLISVFAAVLFIFDTGIFSGESYSFRVYLREGDSRIRSLTSDEAISRGGDPLISASVLSEYCSYGIAGDNELKTIVFPDGSYAEFTPGSSFCLNGENHFLSEDCVFQNGSVYIPLSFYENYISGLNIMRTPTEARLVVDIDISYGKFSLISYSTVAETPLSFSDYFDAVGKSSFETPEFKADLSEYEQYMNPEDKDKYLILINTENKLDKDYIPPELTDLADTRKDGRTTQQMQKCAAMAMEAMLKEAAANGYTSLSITSAYRSYNYQQQLYDNQVNALRASYGDDAPAKAAEAVTLPGASEHQSGLCADLHNLPSASQAFANTEEYSWLVENCAKFGFILRYPKNKTDITGIMFEPWHYRFVGRYHAEIIMSEGLCLEEYMSLISSENTSLDNTDS